MIKYNLKIRNIEASTLYECNIGIRDHYEYKNALFTQSLFHDFLDKIREEDKTRLSSRDLICLEFNYGTRSYEEERTHLKKQLANSIGTEKEARIRELIQKAEDRKNSYMKLTKEDLRHKFYAEGVDVTYYTKKRGGQIKKDRTIHYKMLYRSTGKAKKGTCMFINEDLYDRAFDFLRMGIKIRPENAPIVEISAYSPLVSSTITDTIQIDPENILILKDVDSYFDTSAVCVSTDQDRHCLAEHIDHYRVKNTLFDGQALIDSGIFPENGNGYLLLRHHFCKMAAFNSNIQLFFKDYFGDLYETATVVDMFGKKHLAKDIRLITTNNAMKWLKFDVSYEYWCQKVNENGSQFGIVKTAHKSKLDDVQKMSYQMINALCVDIMPNVISRSVQYIEALKKDDAVFLDYLKKNKNFANDYEVLLSLVNHYPDFIRSDYFRSRRWKIIQAYIFKFRNGEILQNADNLVIAGSPYAMLLHSVGQDIHKDDTFTGESGTIQCYTERFDHDEYLACFRSPFNSKNNMGYLHNVYSEHMSRYFNLGPQIIAVNMIGTDFQDRNNGSDQDSDSLYTTNQPDIVDYAKQCYAGYPTIVNKIQQSPRTYTDCPDSYAEMDIQLANAQMAIGESSNMAQLALTYTYNFKDPKYIDYVCILSVLAQVAIDSAKRSYDVVIADEIKRIKNSMDVKANGYPLFWMSIRPDFNKENINPALACPMNYLQETQFKKFRSPLSTINTTDFLYAFPLDRNMKRRSQKVEDLIEKYSWDLYSTTQCKDNEEAYLLLLTDFDTLIMDIQKTYFSQNYLGLFSWLLNRAFLSTSNIQQKGRVIKSTLYKNRAILLKVLYSANPEAFLQCFSKSARKSVPLMENERLFLA